MTTETATSPAALVTAAAADLGITMRAEFVPFSKSRNAKPDGMGDGKPWRSLNWRVTLERNGREILSTDYAQGEGHVPNPEKYPARSLALAEHVSHAIEKGTIRRGSSFFCKPIASPPLSDVLWSLVQDASAMDYPSFEAWASEYGYSEDSRRAEGIWRSCMDIALKLRAAIGDAGIEAIRTAAEDY